MGICSAKKNKRKVFTDVGSLELSSYRNWYHAKLYFLINKYFIVNNDEYYRVYDLDTGDEVYKYKYSKIVLFARLTKYTFIAVGRQGEEALLVNIPKKEVIKRNFPTITKKHFHDIVSINENLVVAFHPNLLIIYEIPTEKAEKIYLNNREHFASNEVYEGLIMKINESLIAIFYDYNMRDWIYDLVDITTKQIVLEVRCNWVYPLFINVKNGRASLVDNKGLTKNKKDIKYLFMNLLGKIMIDYIYYDDIKYMIDNKIMTFKFFPIYKLENKPIYIFWDGSEIIAFNSKLKQILQKFPINKDLIQPCPRGGNSWRRLEFSDNYFILAFFCYFYCFKIKDNLTNNEYHGAKKENK